MSQQARANYVKLQKVLPELMAKVTEAQTKLHSIDNHLALSLVAVNKSATSSVGGVPTRFTDPFEEFSELFNVSVEEIANVLLATCESIEQIEVATQQLVVGVNTLGVNTQLNPSGTAQPKEGPSTSRSSSTQLAARPPKFPDLANAITSLDAKLRRN
jgi:methyl-accepting chemotaxis protein